MGSEVAVGIASGPLVATILVSWAPGRGEDTALLHKRNLALSDLLFILSVFHRYTLQI